MAEQQFKLDLQFPEIMHLGEGGFGLVSLIQHPVWGEVAFKRNLLNNLNNEEKQRLKSKIKKEADIQKKLNHKNVVTLYDSYLASDDECGIFLEYMKHGAVNEFIENFEVSWQWKMQLIHDISLGMHYLQKQEPPIIHGDLKSQNILIGDGYRAKISDFGLAETLEIAHSETNGQISGTLRYIAPEYLHNRFEAKTEKYDIYGYAIVAWEILSAKHAYYDFFDQKCIGVFIVDQNQRPKITDIDEHIPKCVLDLVEECWHKLQENRPTFKKVKCILDEQMSSIKHALVEPCKIDQSFSSDVIETQSIPELISSTGIEKCITGYKAVRNSLAQYIDPDNGLLWCLNGKEVLTDSDLIQLDSFKSNKIKAKSFLEVNEELLLKYISPKIECCCDKFLEALDENSQRHVALCIINGEMNSDGEERLLTENEISIINDNLFSLVNLMNPYRMDFLYRLISKKCITERHKASIENCSEIKQKIDELLTILKRRSYSDFKHFKLCLHDTMQDKIVDILEMGGIVTVRLKLAKSADRKIIESKLIDLVTGYVDESTEIDKNLTPDQIIIIKDILEELKKSKIHLMGNSAWRSIAVFFQCATYDSYKSLVGFYENGILKGTLERLFRCLLKLSDGDPKLIRDVSITNGSFQIGSISYQINVIQYSSDIEQTSQRMEKQLNSENIDSSSIVRRLLQIKLAMTASTTNGTGSHTKMLNNEDELFDPSLLTKLDWNNKKASYKCDVSPTSPGKDLELRPLSYHDYDKGFINILSQLTVTGDVTQESFTERFQAMKSCPNTYYVLVIEDIRKKQVVGSATLVVEQKFIHSTATRGRIEDVVVDKNCRGLELGKLLVDTLVLLAESFGCYKLTLECKEENIKFYRTLGFDVYEQLNMIRRIKD